MNESELSEACNFAQDLARKCGVMIRKAFKEPKTVETKSSAVDLVTETDEAVEKAIIAAIKIKYPEHDIIGEESTAAGKRIILTDKPTWVIDPVDGTTNFVCKFPYVACCIGLMVNKIPVVGVVYNPIMDEMFHAIKKKGSFKNESQLKVNETTELDKALILSEFGSSREEKLMKSVTDNLLNVVLSPVRGIRSLGSAACNICAVAAGQADAYYETGMHIWDICASGLILQEAGGVTVSTDGSELNYLNRKIIGACTEQIAQKLASKLTQLNPQPDGIAQ